MSTDDAEREPPGDGSPRPIGEVETAIERTPPETHDEFVRQLTEVEPIGEVATAIERSHRPA